MFFIYLFFFDNKSATTVNLKKTDPARANKPINLKSFFSALWVCCQIHGHRVTSYLWIEITNKVMNKSKDVTFENSGLPEKLKYQILNN